MIREINGRKYTDEQIIQVLIDHNRGITWFSDALKVIDGKLDRRTRIANAVALRQKEFEGKSPDRYSEVRDRVEKEEIAKEDKEA